MVANVLQTSTKRKTAHLKPFQFTSDRQPKNRGHKKGRSPTDWLKVLSRTKINFHNPFTGKTDIAEVSVVVGIQLILKATQDGDMAAIKEYYDRIDGKPIQKLIGDKIGNETKIIVVTNGKHNSQDEALPREVPAQQ